MSLSGEGESLDGFDNEQINHFEHLYILPTYTEAESFVSTESVKAKWKRVPRSPSDFIESKSSTSSCRDSQYEAWVEKYYKGLHKDAHKMNFSEVGVDTSDLSQEENVGNIPVSRLDPNFKNKWSFSTKYWGPKQGRRHWAFEKNIGQVFYIPSIHPLLNLRSRYGRFHSQLNSAAAVPELSFKKFMCSSFKKFLEKIEVGEPQLLKLMLCDNLCSFKWFEDMTKSKTVKILCRFMRKQIMLKHVYLENINMSREEGIIFLCALSQNAGSEITELHMWKMFGHGECPVLLNELSRKGDFVSAKPHVKFLSKIHFFQILYKFRNLTSLSVNYAYLANKNGDVLLCFQSLRTGLMKELRILCLRDERPLLTNPGRGVGGFKIPDGVWRRIAEWNPDLQVHFVFLDLVQYENVIVFLSKSIPMSHVHLSSGIDLSFETPWDIDSTLLELRNWYSSTLQDLSLHLWHHRDLLDFILRKKILEEFPNLINFEFIGVLEDVETIEEFCCQLSTGTYKMRTLLFWMQEQQTNQKKCIYSRKRLVEIREKYKRKFEVLDIDADIQTYAI